MPVKSLVFRALKNAYLLDIVIVLPPLFWARKARLRAVFARQITSSHQTTDI
jgi:hypothetical protein